MKKRPLINPAEFTAFPSILDQQPAANIRTSEGNQRCKRDWMEEPSHVVDVCAGQKRATVASAGHS